MPDSTPGAITHSDGDQMRTRILRAIREAERPFNTWAELAEAVGCSRTNAAYHVKRLRQLGLVDFEDRRPWTLILIEP